MKHKSIQTTTMPAGYKMHSDPKKLTAQFNNWAAYISKEVRKIKK